VDLLLGAGGAPEGVIAAAGVKILGGDFQGRLGPENDAERARIVKMGLKNPIALLKLDDLAKGQDLLFVATGVTDSLLLKGVRAESRGHWTHSIVMRQRSGTVRFVEALHPHRK
jgi:fructose-1,6-bisphosphatase II